MSPIGMKKQYPTYVDISAESLDEMAISGGRCGVTLILTPNDLEKTIKCKFEDIKEC